ncbi:MarR family transcriptional regulator [Lagierella sp.]|uniref:MarR family winged helix-turn-helix transcriptional regulator n=1 Tax=Lagierella sp. TaxID=2849657 RepID=UPI00261EEE61|nr:MarR family transcriptional regulator [Lagierella sp.]
MDWTDLGTETAQLVREAARKIDSILLPIAAVNSLTNMKLKVLLEVERLENATIGELGLSLGVAGGNISNMCKGLEKEGLLKRTRSLEDERVVHVATTDKGKEIINSIKEQMNVKLHDKLGSMEKKDYENLVDMLKELNHCLDLLAKN